MTSRPDDDLLTDELRGPAEVFDACLAALRSGGASILECIKLIHQARGCPLGEATAAVANSAAWADQRDAFWQHQQDMFEEFLAFSRDRIASVEHAMRPDGETVVVRLKAPPEHDQGTAEPSAAPDGDEVS